MCCRSVGCGMAMLMLSPMQSDTRNSTAARTVVICVYDAAGHVIETHEQAADFREP
jgi:hypothetical protein